MSVSSDQLVVQSNEFAVRVKRHLLQRIRAMPGAAIVDFDRSTAVFHYHQFGASDRWCDADNSHETRRVTPPELVLQRKALQYTTSFGGDLADNGAAAVGDDANAKRVADNIWRAIKDVHAIDRRRAGIVRHTRRTSYYFTQLSVRVTDDPVLRVKHVGIEFYDLWLRRE